MKAPSFVLILSLLGLCCQKSGKQFEIKTPVKVQLASTVDTLHFVTPARLIPVGDFFCYIDTMAKKYSDSFHYTITEYHLIHSNPWIIDSLAATDYYLMKNQGRQVYDNRSLPILKSTDTIWIPSADRCRQIDQFLDSISIEVNRLAFTLTINNKKQTLYTFSVRVGQNITKYLALAGREVSLQTDTGRGFIYRIEREPYFINPVDGKHFTQTKRDDGYTTMMPLLPWLETEIQGIRNGDMIHPTTNLNTLGKQYSHGCIGLRESDAWRLYYFAPVGTAVHIQ